MKLSFTYILLCMSSLICTALPPLFPSLLPRLHEAIERGNVDGIQSLIALSADPNSLYLNRTALQTALVYKNPTVIKTLLDCGAAVSDDSIAGLLKSGNESYAIGYVYTSLRLLLAAGATTGDMLSLPRGYLTPVMLAHADTETIHKKVTDIIGYYGKQKIA